MVSGVVGNNTHRALDPKEFRGFALADSFAPLVFINGKDAKAAQIFTLAHEIAHLWLGESGVSNPQADFVEDADFLADAESTPQHSSERWCNNVAAELLVPARMLREEFNAVTQLSIEANRLARRFKVSVPVVLRRIKDVVGLSDDAYWQAYRQAAKQAQESQTQKKWRRLSYRNVWCSLQHSLCARPSCQRFGGSYVVHRIHAAARTSRILQCLGHSRRSWESARRWRISSMPKSSFGPRTCTTGSTSVRHFGNGSYDRIRLADCIASKELAMNYWPGQMNWPIGPVREAKSFFLSPHESLFPCYGMRSVPGLPDRITPRPR